MTPREETVASPHFMEELPPDDATSMAEAMKHDVRFEDAKTEDLELAIEFLPSLTGWKSVTPIRQTIFLYKLFFSRQFFVHRIGGLLFLIQYALAFYLYFADYPAFKNSILIWSLPATGIFQSVNAVYTFTFLPKSKKDGGYFGDKSILSYPFIIENSFYAMILFYQWVYYDNTFVKYISGSILLEQVFVFFPYVIRQMWPKTSFRDSANNSRNRSEKNYFFFTVATYVTKMFYIWAKHYIGFFLNYARFLDRIDEEEKYYIHHILVFSSFATTIAVFLQTLKFKRYMGPRLSFLIYFGSYMGTFYGFVNIGHIFWANPDLTLITLGGLIVNFQKLPVQIGYQVADIKKADRVYYFSPNPFKIRLCLLHKRIPFETVEVEHIEIRDDLTKRFGAKATVPAIELDDGTIICDSFKIAEYLEKTYPDTPSVFSGTSEKASEAEIRIGKVLSRSFEIGIPSWSGTFELIFHELTGAFAEGSENRAYFLSDDRLGPNGYQTILARTADKEPLKKFSINGLKPLASILRDRPGEFFQGKVPGFVDFLVFGRYAMVRNANPAVAKEVFVDAIPELGEWIDRMLKLYPEVLPHLRPM
ncbi:hypothetical protein HDU67_006826 [Dinochytrium kinnereticum]|nr:hypothetical protein HDU67_006826 [Dinochytrium kinnereticum]